MALILHRVPGTKLFINVAPVQGAEWAKKATFCFYHHAETSAPSIDFAATKTLRGAYAFLPPHVGAPFDILATKLARVSPVNGNLLWWMKCDWETRAHELSFAGGQALATLELSLWRFSTLPDVGNGSAELFVRVPMGARVAFEADHLVVSGPGIQLVTYVDDKPLRQTPANQQIEVRMEPGPRCATVTGSLGPADTASWAAALTPQVRYMWNQHGFAIVKPARILSHDPAEHADVAAHFQLQSFSPDRTVTRIALVTENAATARLMSFLPDTNNHDVDLQPAREAAIYFEQSGDTDAYASLSGEFRVAAPRASLPADSTTTRDIMPGSAGTEFFQLGKDGFDGLRFVPGKPAFVRFTDGSDAASLTDDLTTAWVAPCRTGETAPWSTAPYSFVAQPEDEPLYSRRNADGVVPASAPSANTTVMFDPAPSRVPPDTSLPFFPFRGVRDGSLVQTDVLDTAALAPERSRLVGEAKLRTTRPMALAATTDLKWITTPQGLLVEIDSANDWHQIRLGEGTDWQMNIKRPSQGDKPVVRWALQEALSRSDVFVVVSRRQLGNSRAPNDPALGDIELKVAIRGWSLAVNILSTSETTFAAAEERERPIPPESGLAPVLILKLSKGSLEGMLGDVGRWALPRFFNQSPQAMSTGALKSLANLKTLSEGRSPMVKPDAPSEYQKLAPELKSHYEDLYKKITDPEWTGVLVMNAHVPFDGVPGQLAALTQGLGEDEEDRGKKEPLPFIVPVLGLDLSRVVPAEDGQLRMERSSAFGAIHYHSPEPLPHEDPGFAFKVQTVNAIFDNSDLRTFLASMQLRLGELFGATTKADNKRLVDIVCRYEQKAGAGPEPEYTFRALSTRTMAFAGNAFLDKLTVNRIDLTSRKVENGRQQVVESRFAIWGVIEFAPPFSKVTGIRKIAYESAALVLTGSDFDVDYGNVRVEFKKDGDSAVSGLLAKFPFQLSSLRWASGSPLELPSIGFTPISLPGFPDLKEPSFDFALELDLNLGSMGKLFEAAEFLKGRILIGWYKATSTLRGFCIGFRFDGGNGPLDIGVNGVMRLTADAVNLQSYEQPAGIGIGLRNPQLEVMGYKVPAKPRDTLVAFLPGGESNVAWAWARLDTDVGPVKLHYFALGQRMHLVKPGAFDGSAKLSDIIKGSRDWVQPRQSNGKAELPDIGRLYTGEAGWGVVADGEVSAFKFRFVFLDGLNRYGLGLNIPNIADIDVLYRKLSDGVGVFSAEIVPAFRTLEMGAATVTLPIVSFDALTNGNWSINIGYHGNDFSRGTAVQLLPFLGSGGLRFGKLDWRSSYVLNSPHSKNGPLIQRLKLDPVIEMSMAVRVGIGKEYREGVFAAGISLSVYGVFEGALGRPTDPAFPSGAPRRYIKIAGTVGLLLEIYGVVHFALVSAAVSIRAWIETGITLESWTPVVVHAEAGVSVHVRFVIARFKIFGKRIEIAIHFSFSTRVRFTQELPYAFDGDNPYGNSARIASLAREAALLAHEATEPLLWEPHALGAVVPLGTAVTLEPMLGDKGPVLLPMLFAGDTAVDTALSEFTTRLFLWSLRLSLGIEPGTATPEKVTLAALSALSSRVSPPKGMSLARWGARPLDFNAFQAFVQKHLRIELKNVADLLVAQKAALQAAGLPANDTARGVLLPWFADIAIHKIAKGGVAEVLRDFRTDHSRPVNEAWERALHDKLSEAVPDYPLNEPERVKLMASMRLHILQQGNKEALDAITEDWAAALVQGVTQRALMLARDLAKPPKEGAEPEVPVAALVQALAAPADGGSLAAQVGKHASTFLHHGLRVPESAGDSATLPLSQFLHTELALSEFAAAKEWGLEFAPRASFQGGWIAGTARVGNLQTADAAAHLELLAKRLLGRKIELTAYLEDGDFAQTTQPRRFIADTLVPLEGSSTGAGSFRTATVPPALAALAQRRGGPLQVVPRLEIPREVGRDKPCPSRWFVKIDVQLQARNVNNGRPVYSVHHVDVRIRALLRQMINGGQQPLVTKVRLAYQVKDAAAAVPVEFLEQEEAFFFVSNMSKEPNPPQVALFGLTRSSTPTHATLRDVDRLAQILWMAGTVNAPGFHLGFRGGKDPIAHLFEQAAVGTVSLLFELDPTSPFTPLVDGLLIDAALVEEKHVVSLTVPQVREAVTGTPDGQVAVIVERVNPLHGMTSTTSDDEADLRYLMGRYELVDYGTDQAKAPIARGNVIPTRLVLNEDEQQAAAQEEQPRILRHRILVPVAKIMGESNPYRVVGTDIAQLVKIGLRDGAGHYLDDDARNVEWVAGRPTQLLYRDALPRLQELPGVEATWRLGPQGQDAAVQVVLRWSAENLFSKKRELAAKQREALVALFQRATHAAGAKDFSASLEVAIDGKVVANAAVAGEVGTWLEAITRQLSNRKDEPQPLPLTAIIPAMQWPAATPQPVRLEVAVGFYRNPDLCDQRLLDHDQNGNVSEAEKKASDIASVRSPVMAEALETPTQWKKWADDVGKAFQKSFSLLRRLEADVETQAERPLGAAVWLMRRNMLTTAETTATASGFFAPAPLARTMRSGLVQVEEADGRSTEVDARDVDLNAVATRAASALERMVSQAVGLALCQWRPELYSRLAIAKRGVADAMAARLESILDQAGNVPDEAIEKFRNVCRSNTRTSFAPAAVVNVRLSAAAAGRTYLWGTVSIAAPNATPDELSPFSFSPVRIPLGAAGIEGSFDFVVQWADPGANPLAVVSGAMNMRPRYVEVKGEREIDGYIPSDWYEVVWSGEMGTKSDISVRPMTGQTWNVPLPLRLIPPTPTILRHSVTPGQPEAAADLDVYIGMARSWQYGVSMMVPAMDHDTAELTVRFSHAAGLASLARDTLFEVLVAYNHHAQAIDVVANDLTATGKADPNDLELAVKLFEKIADALASPPLGVAKLQSANDDVRVVQLRTNRFSQKQLPAEIRWAVLPAEHQQSVRTSLLHLKSLTEDDSVLAPDSTDPAQGTARYERGADAEAAVGGTASLSPRHVRLSRLDVMVQGRAMPTVMARRNADLLAGGGRISPSFIFETSTVGTPDALVPRLAHRRRFDLSAGSGSKSMAHWLTRLREALVRNADADKFVFDVTARIRFTLAREEGLAIETFTPQAALKSAPAGARDWVATLARRYLAAIGRLSPQARRNGELQLHVQAYPVGAGDGQKPVLSLTGLYLPLAKVTDTQLAVLANADGAGAAVLPQHQIAAYIFERTRNLSAHTANTAQYRSALAAAAEHDYDEASAAHLPSSADLASEEGREAWIEALEAAAAARQPKD
jgi:hypothetical protein